MLSGVNSRRRGTLSREGVSHAKTPRSQRNRIIGIAARRPTAMRPPDRMTSYGTHPSRRWIADPSDPVWFWFVFNVEVVFASSRLSVRIPPRHGRETSHRSDGLGTPPWGASDSVEIQDPLLSAGTERRSTRVMRSPHGCGRTTSTDRRFVGRGWGRWGASRHVGR